MVNLIKFFKKEDRWEHLQKTLSEAFLKIKYDAQYLFNWIHYLSEKNEHNEQHHNIFYNELKTQREFIIHLNEEIKYLKTKLNILETPQEQRQGQLRTSQRTTEDKSKDMSLKEKDKSKDIKIHNIDRSSMTESQLELLNLLYHSDKPLSYLDIAGIVGKKEKSVRNLVYEIREKGINVLSKSIGARTKGFYLNKEEKIKVSGR